MEWTCAIGLQAPAVCPFGRKADPPVRVPDAQESHRTQYICGGDKMRSRSTTRRRTENLIHGFYAFFLLVLVLVPPPPYSVIMNVGARATPIARRIHQHQEQTTLDNLVAVC